MSHISGAVDITSDHEPSLTVTSNGTVLLDLDGAVSARFASLAQFDRVIEHLDRQRVGFGEQQMLEVQTHNIVSWVEGPRSGWFQCSCRMWFVTEGYDSEDKSMGAIISAHQAKVSSSPEAPR